MRYKGILIEKNNVCYVVGGEDCPHDSIMVQQAQQGICKLFHGEWVEFSIINECYNYNGAHVGKDCSCKGGDIRDVAVILSV